LKVYYSYKEFDVSKPVITIGVFDGVHKGHVEILKRLNNIANSVEGESVVLTFWPHPRMVLKQDTDIKLINTLTEKEELLRQNGVKHLVVIPFTEEFSHLSSNDFIKNILVDALHVKQLVIGFNHHFGRGREGNYDSIKQFGDLYGFGIEKLDAQLVENEKVSSTHIRKALDIGDIELANKYLGYSYQFTGIIIKGNKIGTKLGFPTANISSKHDYKIIPYLGVYAAYATVQGLKYQAMVNIGYRPTVNIHPVSLTIEAHLIDFSGDLYSKEITLSFIKRVRDELKFHGLDELKNQLYKDKEEIVKILS